MVVNERAESLSKPHNLSPEGHSREELEAVTHHGSPNTLLQWAPLGNLTENTTSAGKPLFVQSSEVMKLKLGIEKIRLLGAGLQLPESVLERAAFLFRRAKKGNINVITSVIAIVAVWAACRENNRNCSIDEMVAMLRLKRSGQMLSAMSRLCAFWQIKVNQGNSESLIYSWAHELQLPRSVIERALEVNRIASQKHHRSPFVIAAAAIWFAASEGLPSKPRKDILKAENLEKVSHRQQNSISPIVRLMKEDIEFRPKYKPKTDMEINRQHGSLLQETMKRIVSKTLPKDSTPCQHCPLEINTRGAIYSCKCGFKDACRDCMLEHLSEKDYHRRMKTELSTVQS